MNILVTGAWQYTDEQLESLKQMGHTVSVLSDERDEIPCPYDDIEGVICNGLFLYHDIEKFKNLRYIQTTSAGLDRIPMEYVKENNIELHNARGVYSIPMAEFAVCGVLQLYKKSKFFMDNQSLHKWEKHRNLLELSGKTVCILGCGSVGTECAKRFRAFACQVIGIDIVVRTDENFTEILPLSEMDKALLISDIVVLTLPLTDETRGMFDERKFSVMKKGALFVNIARGQIVDQAAMIDALKNRLFGAVLDVFDEEPLSENSPLWDMENVIVTPHNSFHGEGNGDRLFEGIYQNSEKLL